MYLLVGASEGIWGPLRSASRVLDAVVISLLGSGFSGDGARALVVVVEIAGNGVDDIVAPNGPSVNALPWNAGDDGVSLDTPSWSESSTVVAFLTVDADVDLFVLSQFGEGRFEAVDLSVEVGLSRDNIVPGLELERDGEL